MGLLVTGWIIALVAFVAGATWAGLGQRCGADDVEGER